MKVVQAYRINNPDKLRLTCDVYNSLKRGPGQKVISIVYSADRDVNLRGLVESAKQYYPDWIIRMYYSRDQLNASSTCARQCLRDNVNGKLYDNLDLCDVDSIPIGLVDKWSGKYLLEKSWRWLPAGDHFVQVFLSRELTACFIERELAAVNEWLDTNKSVHVMRGISHLSYLAKFLLTLFVFAKKYL